MIFQTRLVVEPFKRTFVSETVLHRLLKKNILLRIKKAKEQKTNMFIYENVSENKYWILLFQVFYGL